MNNVYVYGLMVTKKKICLQKFHSRSWHTCEKNHDIKILNIYCVHVLEEKKML